MNESYGLNGSFLDEISHQVEYKIDVKCAYILFMEILRFSINPRVRGKIFCFYKTDPHEFATFMQNFGMSVSFSAKFSLNNNCLYFPLNFIKLLFDFQNNFLTICHNMMFLQIICIIIFPY